MEPAECIPRRPVSDHRNGWNLTEELAVNVTEKCLFVNFLRFAQIHRLGLDRAQGLPGR